MDCSCVESLFINLQVALKQHCFQQVSQDWSPCCIIFMRGAFKRANANLVDQGQIFNKTVLKALQLVLYISFVTKTVVA